MKYHTKYTRDTEAEASDLVEYLAGDGVVLDRSGVKLTESELHRFALAAERDEMLRLHSAMMSEEHSIDELGNAGRQTARDHLSGRWIVGIHHENVGKPHIHIGQSGDEADCWMDSDDIYTLRSHLAALLGERIGEAPETV